MTGMGLIAFGAGTPEAIQPAGPRTMAVSTGQRITVVSDATGHRHDEAGAARRCSPRERVVRETLNSSPNSSWCVGPGIVEFEQVVAL
jgi:hypothetical protein